MLLAEELLLLGLDPVEGTVVNNARRERLAGALAGELALGGLVDPPGKRFIAVGRPPDDPLSAAAHQALARFTGRRAAAQLRGLDEGIGGVWSRLLEVVAPDKAGRPHARRRIKTATELTPVAPVVKKVIAEMHAAAAGAAAAAGGAASSS